MSKKELSTQEIVKLAAEAGAKAAMETLDKERKRDRREMVDRRLHNTMLLLRNYRVFKDFADNAIYEAEGLETPEQILADLMMPGRDSSVTVESIKKSVARTVTIVKHMDVMMGLYEAYCHGTGSPEDMRRWAVVNALYTGPEEDRRSINQLAKEYGVVDRTIYNDVKIASERIAALMFGIDGIRKD